MTTKEIKVLEKIKELSLSESNSLFKPIHYLRLIDTIFTKDVISKYKGIKIKNMACAYLGKMARKDYIQASYGFINGYSFFEGYYLQQNGIDSLIVYRKTRYKIYFTDAIGFKTCYMNGASWSIKEQAEHEIELLKADNIKYKKGRTRFRLKKATMK